MITYLGVPFVGQYVTVIWTLCSLPTEDCIKPLHISHVAELTVTCIFFKLRNSAYVWFPYRRKQTIYLPNALNGMCVSACVNSVRAFVYCVSMCMSARMCLNEWKCVLRVGCECAAIGDHK